jgi:hypothetical protein
LIKLIKLYLSSLLLLEQNATAVHVDGLLVENEAARGVSAQLPPRHCYRCC